MQTHKKYVVYELKKILASRQMSLEEVDFGGVVSNCFDTKKEAIKALKDANKFHTDYIILYSVRLTNW